jgi:hypothetical protein
MYTATLVFSNRCETRCSYKRTISSSIKNVSSLGSVEDDPFLLPFAASNAVHPARPENSRIDGSQSEGFFFHKDQDCFAFFPVNIRYTKHEHVLQNITVCFEH